MFSLLRRAPQPGPVFVCAMNEAAELASRLQAGLLVSISDPERRAITREYLGRIRAKTCPLDFHDIERSAPDLTAPEMHHIEDALNAAKRAPVRRPILVHCHAGISRSSAIAIILATGRHLSTGQDPADAVNLAVSDIRRATPHARPNMRIIELGATALGVRATSLIDQAWGMHRGDLVDTE
jgi:predicted protein tyrosine phosphatase